MHSGTELPADLCNSLLAALSAHGSFNIARQLFDEMLIRGVQFSSVGFGCFIGKLCRVGELKETMLLVQRVKQQLSGQIDGSVVAALIVDGLCRAGRIDDAWEVLDQLRKIGCKPDFLAYRILSEGFKSMCRLEEMERILKQKRKLGVAPRVNVYGEFILSLISVRRISEAKELAEAIVDGDFPMEDAVLNALIGSVSAVDIDSSILFCKYMIRKDKVLSITSLKDLSKNLCKQGRDGEMWDIYQVFLGKEHFKRVEHYNVMVSFLCKAGKAREAYDILKQMKKKGFRPDICTYNFLFKALCQDDLLRPAKRLWDEIFTSGYCANLHTYNILIQKFLQVGESKEAHRLFNQMLRKGVAPDVVTYSSIMELLCKENRIAEALDVFHKCLEQDPTIASSTLNALVDSLCKKGKYVSASHVMRGVPASTASHDSQLILLKSFAEAGEFDLAIEHLYSIKRVSHMELENIVNKLLHSLSTTPNLGLLLQLLQKMQSHGLISHCQALMLFDV
ncbi:hypothetical protein HPP92_009562 [Vanilla planifolia]|uniref:Pentatricopeptide repeat-containing protein n=1 Tax=Vanilla planifolia TaxID=51239 RepID=A0A835RB84_VANPL|nr:hypothetical protein HPP92_009778 [Vanilla planifolia]KAG0487467.1 hypothetical protein HPP92_009562 [Vanilla planifolia]